MPTPDSAWNLFTPQMMDPKNLMAMNQPANDQGVPQLLQPSPEQMAALKLQQQQKAQAEEEAKSIAVEKADQLAGVQPKAAPQRPPPYSAPNATDGLPPDAMASYLKAISDRGQGVQSEKDQMTAMGDRPSGFNALDLSPMASLVDSMTGSTLAKDYKGPQQLQQWDQKKALLQAAIDKSSDKVSDDQLNYLKMLSDNTNKKSGDDMRVQIAELKGLAQGKNGSMDLREAQEGGRAANRIHNDGDLRAMVTQGRNVDRGLHTLDGNASWTAVNEVAQDFAAALSGKGIATDFKLKGITKPMLDEKIASYKTWLQSNPNQPAPKEVVDFWKAMGQRLGEAYDNQITARAVSRTKGLHQAYAGFPNILNSVNEAARSYAHGNWRNTDDFADVSQMERPGSQSSGPKVGDEVDGHVFLGGDPNSPNSWKAK